MRKILEFKKKDHTKIVEQYELEGCDEDLLDLVEKMVSCNPAGKRKKTTGELSDDELDMAAGGILLPGMPDEMLKKLLEQYGTEE